jgi:hypothetical protein
VGRILVGASVAEGKRRSNPGSGQLGASGRARPSCLSQPSATTLPNKPLQPTKPTVFISEPGASARTRAPAGVATFSLPASRLNGSIVGQTDGERVRDRATRRGAGGATASVARRAFTTVTLGDTWSRAFSGLTEELNLWKS